MLINEIFSSIEGEGIRTGYPATFIRSFGCSCRCTYCDSLYAVAPETEEDKANAYKEMTIYEILKKCKELKNKKITFTGGEPLLQHDAAQLVVALLKEEYEVNIETNGAEDIEKFRHKLVEQGINEIPEEIKDKNLIFTADYKCYTSGMNDKMILSNLTTGLKENDVLKFVVGSIDDLDLMKYLVTHYKPKYQVFVSPVFGKIEPKQIVEYVIANDLQSVRVQLQLHKFIWPVDMRGV